LKEKATWRYGAIALFGFVCILIITHPSDFGSVKGIILAAGMGLSFSLYVVMTRMLRDEPTLTNLFYTAVGVLIPLSFRLPIFWKPLTFRGGLLMVIIGLLGFALLWVLDKAMDMISPTVAAAFFYSQMFWIVIIRLIASIL
jgi:drug/metabolite transporter (DMT)-like permease